MKIKVIGKRQGVSKKSGKPYLQVAYLDKMNGGEGESGDSLFLDPTEHDYNSVIIGKFYEVEFNRGGFLTSFKPAQ